MSKNRNEIIINILVFIGALLFLIGLGLGLLGIRLGMQVVQDWETLHQSPSDQTKMKFNASLGMAKELVGTIGTLATIGGGIVLFLNFKNATKNAEIANRNAEIAKRNAEIAESRLITERFSKAVEQLGHEEISTRLGSIYALERIALDSDRDHWTVMEVLTSFIQEKSHSNQEKDLSQANNNNSKLIGKDIQAALKVIGRRKYDRDPDDKSLDLSFSNLAKANLNCAVLKRANFYKANLRGVNLRKADLSEAYLGEADLSKANLRGAYLGEADLSKANLREADLSEAYLGGADLREADLSEASLYEVKGKGGTILYETKLRKANLCGLDFTEAEAIFYKTDVEEAELTEAIFYETDLEEWDLRLNNVPIKFWTMLLNIDCLAGILFLRKSRSTALVNLNKARHNKIKSKELKPVSIKYSNKPSVQVYITPELKYILELAIGLAQADRDEPKKVRETKAKKAQSLSKVSFLEDVARNTTQNFVHPADSNKEKTRTRHLFAAILKLNPPQLENVLQELSIKEALPEPISYTVLEKPKRGTLSQDISFSPCLYNAFVQLKKYSNKNSPISTSDVFFDIAMYGTDRSHSVKLLRDKGIDKERVEKYIQEHNINVKQRPVVK